MGNDYIQTLVNFGISILIPAAFISFYWMRDKYFIRYKIQREYVFKERIGIKNKLSKSKTPLIKAAEELNFRLWNLSQNINEGWTKCEDLEQLKIKGNFYYIKSSVYRLLTFFYWLERSEMDIYDFDFSMADKKDALYLKYIKTLKHFFCDNDLFSGIKYDYNYENAHFFKDHISVFTKYISKDNCNMSYEEFLIKFENNFEEISPIVKYICSLDSSEDNLQYNVLMSFHLFLMLFLNKYGLDYHYTPKKKFDKLIKEKYYTIIIKTGLVKFFDRNKIDTEVKWIIKGLKL